MVSGVLSSRQNEGVARELLNYYYLTQEEVVQKRKATHVQKK
jgi:hypothetical protein